MRSDWFVTSGAQELRAGSALSYREYLRRSEEERATPQYEDDLRQIELDLPRTGASIRQFLLQEDATDEELPADVMQPFVDVLKNILVAYSVRNPRVGYVQGHADVLCFLLGNVNGRRDEEEAFWVYASVMERVFPEDFFARSPKLHGFQVDCKLFSELVARKLIPLYPVLEKVDLPLVTTLLSCKWFVPVWVGELPETLLYEVWDTMLREEDGAILHLLMALHFFRLAVDKIQHHMETEQWDSSYIYKIILDQCQNATEIDPQTLLQQARSLYGLKDESVEDMRAALRRLPQLRKSEFGVLAKQTHFSHLEIERLQDEFTFLRFQRKTCGRAKLRGLRQEELESILSREFTTWPPDAFGRMYRLLKPDGYGNVSFSSLLQLLSTISRGTLEEKAHLLFQIPNVRELDYLDQQGIEQLADLLCCLLANRVVADAGGHRSQELRRRERIDCIGDASKSPLLRQHFRAKLQSLATSDGQLHYIQWLEFALFDSEVSQLMVWETVRRRSGGVLRSKTRSVSFWSMTPIQPALNRASSDTLLQQQRRSSAKENSPETEKATEGPEIVAAPLAQREGTNNFGADAAPFLKKPASSPRADLVGRRQVTLLSKKMLKKFKSCWPPADAEALCRNPFEGRHGASGAGAPYVFWCECTIS